jgi:hypothetical protein
MDHHARVLQQRIEVAPVGRRREQAVERVRGEQHEGEEPGADETHDAEHARRHLLGEVGAEEAHRGHPDAEHQAPEEQRSFMAAPCAGDAVVQRQSAVRIQRHVLHGEVVGREGVDEAAEGECDEQRLPLRRRPSERHPCKVSASRPHKRERSLEQGDREGQRERELSELGNHLVWTVSCAFFACSRAWAASGGM